MIGLRVLVMEDDAVLAALLMDVLADMGHEVCAVEATESGAVAAAMRCRPDLLIVDARLAKGTGMSAVTQILRAAFVPHLFVSGDVLAVLALRPGAVVIQKPFRERDLVQAIQRAMDAAPEAEALL